MILKWKVLLIHQFCFSNCEHLDRHDSSREASLGGEGGAPRPGLLGGGMEGEGAGEEETLYGGPRGHPVREGEGEGETQDNGPCAVRSLFTR